MEDSFENRLAGQAPQATPVVAPAKKKGGKGWMVCSIILMVLLIGAGTFAAILFLNKDNTDTVALKKQIEDKDAKISKLENDLSNVEECPAVKPTETKCDTPTTSTTEFDVDINALKTTVKGLKYNDYTDVVVKMYQDKKYIVATGSAWEGSSSVALYMYKENKAGSAWNKLADTQNGFSCSSLTALQRSVLKNIETCLTDDGMDVVIDENATK